MSNKKKTKTKTKKTKIVEVSTLTFTNEVKRLENLLIPKVVWDNITNDSKSIYDMLGKIVKHFATLEIHLAFTTWKINDPIYDVNSKGEMVTFSKGTIIFEIFSTDLLFNKLIHWDHTWNDPSLFKGSSAIPLLEYNTSDSIIKKINANVKTQDTAFITFMPLTDTKEIIGMIAHAANNYEQISNLGLDSITKMISKAFNIKQFAQTDSKTDSKTDSTKETPKETTKVTREAQIKYIIDAYKYVKDGTSGHIVKDTYQLNKDPEFKTDLMKYYSETGTYPSYLLFGGYSIDIDIIGMHGFYSFQYVGVKNTGLYDGIYMVEHVKHAITKESYTTTLSCKLLIPKVKNVDTSTTGTNTGTNTGTGTETETEPIIIEVPKGDPRLNSIPSSSFKLYDSEEINPFFH